MRQKKFIDLFAGIGAFHQALKEKEYLCRFAVEIDKHAIETYRFNYPGTEVLEDITKEEVIEKIIKEKDIDMITAGFPCQPFSKAGKRNGFDHESGNLFYNIINLVNKYNSIFTKSPIKFLFFENVGFLKNHDDSVTWNKMKNTILNNHYKIIHDDIITNPINIGIPQNRIRMFLFCVHESYYSEYHKKNQQKYLEIDKIFAHNENVNNFALDFIKDVNINNYNFLEEERRIVLDIWEEFVQELNLKFLGFPIWLKFFGFEYEDTELFRKDIFSKEKKIYKWKENFFEKNRSFYLKNKNLIDKWYEKNKDILLKKVTYQKFEWNAGESIHSIKEGIIQFRHSGIRIKRPNFFPTLVKMVHTPIIWDNKCKNYRYLSVEEALKLQSFPITGQNSFKFPEGYLSTEAFKRIGNSINVKVISKILEYFLV